MSDNHSDLHALIKIKTEVCNPFASDQMLREFAENYLRDKLNFA